MIETSAVLSASDRSSSIFLLSVSGESLIKSLCSAKNGWICIVRLNTGITEMSIVC